MFELLHFFRMQNYTIQNMISSVHFYRNNITMEQDRSRRDLEALEYSLSPRAGGMVTTIIRYPSFFRPLEVLISIVTTLRFSLSVECISPVVKRNFYGRVAAIMTEQHRYFYIIKPTNEKGGKEKPLYTFHLVLTCYAIHDITFFFPG